MKKIIEGNRRERRGIEGNKGYHRGQGGEGALEGEGEEGGWSEVPCEVWGI